MSEVFISYAKEDAEVAGDLARELERRGVAVWWDNRLTADQSYSEGINAAIDKAKAVIVVWSAVARDTEWVTGEAERGRGQRKLISTFAPGFDPADLRAPFNMRHSVPVENLADIMTALGKLGVAAKRKKSAQVPHTRVPPSAPRSIREPELRPAPYIARRASRRPAWAALLAACLVLGLGIGWFFWPDAERKAFEAAREAGTALSLFTTALLLFLFDHA
jgi:hypothetical protein